MNTQPFSDAHFAVFPEELPRRCILAATSEKGNCSKCGKPWVRVVEQKHPEGDGRLKYDSKFSECATGLTPQGFHRTASIENERSASREEAAEMFPGDPVAQQRYINEIHDHGGIRRTETLGWKPQCNCDAPAEPAVVLDCFSGAGTTGLVAKQLGRKAILIDASEDYCRMAQRRIEEVPIPMELSC